MSFTSEFGLAYPILQAPIGSLASVELAAAVSIAGGMGSLALTWSEPEIAAKQVLDLKARTDKPFFVNFVLAFETKALMPALESGAPVVTFSWGLPGDLVHTVHSFGARVGVQVGSIDGALKAIEQRCDFLICQGMEAGGHVQSSFPVFELLTAVRASAKGTPIVAAGGITTGEDIAKFMSMGADAVMLGTRFVAATESLAHPAYKAALVKAGLKDTVLTGCFEGGWPYASHRVLRNATLAQWEAAGCPPVGKRPGEGEVIATMSSGRQIARYEDMPPTLHMTGDVLSCPLYAGSGAVNIKRVEPAAEIVLDLSNAMSSKTTK